MDQEKERLLNETHEELHRLCMGDMAIERIHEVDWIRTVLAPDFTGFGTAEHEQYTVENFVDFMKKIRRDAEGIAVELLREEKVRMLSQDENVAIIKEHWTMKLKIGEMQEQFSFRVTDVYEYVDDRWQWWHLHISIPDAMHQKSESFPTAELQTRNQELERLVAEKTAELRQRNRALEIEAAFERVRAKAMAMRSSDDLHEVADELRRQMGLLGQRDLEVCTIHLYELHEDAFEAMAAIRPPGDEEKIFKMQSKIPNSGIKIVEEMIAMYRSDQEEYVVVNEGEKAVEWFEVIKANNPEVHQLLAGAFEEIPRAYWSFADFSGGSLGIITYAPPEDDARDLLRRSAAVFDLAYRRFLDLQKTEAQARRIEKEKNRLEKALQELQATQNQLIHQEKLASLGQLTAGIAHEIKNPLNFVNNFSDLSTELIEEVMEEMKSLDDSKAKAVISGLLTDVKSNINKIHEHGRRADGIVRSMLMHSRGSKGGLEPMDLNALVEEYVNLAFHGMRAGKDAINVTIDLELDENVGKIPLVAEDFSRVILNLCGNAFDAMRDKLRQQNDKGYQPELRVRTKRTQGEIRVEVSDNGPGIPEALREKVLQPFFTTKKGTHGTGLGLSITHDIVKAHGGQIEVNSGSEAGTTFSISLPVEHK